MSSCAASCCTFCPAAWCVSATSAYSQTADEVLPSNDAAFCSAQRHAPSHPSRPACAVQHAPASCSLSNASPAASSTSIPAWSRPSQGGAVLIAHENLNAPAVIIHPPRCRACARDAGVRSVCGHESRKARLQAPLRPPPPPKPPSHRSDSFNAPIQQPKKTTCRPLKSHR